jgi:hypothetical protein
MAYTNIKKPSDYFNTKLYTGTGSSQGITGVGFQPDFTWIKKRNGAVGHRLYDAVRGATNTLYSDDSAAEATGQTNTLTSFNSDGFTVVSESGVNASSDTYASWNWLGANGTAANTDGSISSTVSTNTTSGFSIVSYTGNGSNNATVGHGLGVKPDCLIVKNRDDNDGWGFWNKGLGAETQQLVLNLSIAVFTDDIFKSSSSTTVTLGVDSYSNTNGEKYIMYAFAEKQGYSKFGSYTGNGSADGTFVYTGFKPAFVMIKRTDTTDNWKMIDNRRIGYNGGTYFLDANRNVAEETTVPAYFDILSNGFKARNSWTPINASGGNYIYMAFAENPLVGTNNIPATAR